MSLVKKTSPRETALTWLVAVIEGRSVNQLLHSKPEALNGQEIAQAKQLLFGSLRFYFQLKTLLDNLLQKPLKAKDNDILGILILGLYQLKYLSTPDHAAISESVELSKKIKKSWSSGLVNGVLRHYQREAKNLDQQLQKAVQYQYAHPGWMVKKLKADWPAHYEAILTENNQQGPMTIRVNRLKLSRSAYQKKLEAEEIQSTCHPLAKDALVLETPCDVYQLPGFIQGEVTVQDAAPQLAVELMQLEKDQRVLDGCAAPGGKTTHLIQTCPENQLIAVEISESRAQRITETLDRLEMSCELICEDFLATDKWWDKQPFDRILLDVPCSASGVIRRNPDIKLHRKTTDMLALTELQQSMLIKAWDMLAPGGVLVYATCSVFKQENELQIKAFIDANAASIIALPGKIEEALTNPAEIGYQLLPGEFQMDGFYLCGLQKPAN